MIVTTVDNQSEMLTHHSAVSIKQRLNENYELSFSVIPTKQNAHSYPLVQNDAAVTVEGETFIVKSLSDDPYLKSVNAEHCFFDECLTDFVEDTLPDGLYTIQRALDLVFSTSEWGYKVVGSFAQMTLIDFGNDNPIALLNTVLETWSVEYDVSASSKKTTIQKQLGVQTDFQIRYKHNMKAISKSGTSDNVRTCVRVYYDPDDFGNYKASLVYESPYINDYRKPRWEKPFYLDDVTTRSAALAYARQHLNDTPDISLTVELTELQKVGYASDDVRLGNSVYLIDERMQLQGTARIVEIERFPYDRSRAPIVTITSFKKSITDAVVKQKSAQKQLEKTAVKQKVIYNGCTITPEEGFKAMAENGVIAFLNASEGIAILRNGVYKFYVNPDGELILDGRLLITGNGKTLFDGYLDENGGKLDIFDINGNLNVKIGSNYFNTNTTGGAMTLFSDGDELSDIRVELYIDKDTDTGALVLRGKGGERRIRLDSSSSDGESNLVLASLDGRVKTIISETYGLINGDEIITKGALSAEIATLKDWVRDELRYIKDEIDDLWDETDDLWRAMPSGD